MRIRSGKLNLGCLGNIDYKWFPRDNLDIERGNGGRGYWQFSGHIFEWNTLAETVWFLGRYCGYTIANSFLYIDWRRWRRKDCFSPFLNYLVRRKN